MDWHRIASPVFWFQNYRTDWDYDKFLNEMIDTHGVVVEGYFHARVGDLLVWVENWPYCYGKPEGGDSATVLPSVKTRKRIRKLLSQVKHRWNK